VSSGGGNVADERRVYTAALAVAGRLTAGRDFLVDPRDRIVQLTEVGGAELDQFTRPLGGVWASRRRREELTRQALTALHLYHRDRHYVVRDRKVHVIDEFTGRLMSDRWWERGLHQLSEVRGRCRVRAQHEPLARISYQRFFRRYLRLGGMTGTARETAGELWSVYRLAVVAVPTNRRLQRRGAPDRVPSAAAGEGGGLGGPDGVTPPGARRAP